MLERRGDLAADLSAVRCHLRVATLDEIAKYGVSGVRDRRLLPPMAGGATPKWYANGLLDCLNGNATAGLNVDLNGDTIKLMLVTSAYTPNQATHATRSDLGANEATGGSGYPALGFTLGSLTTSVSSLTVNWDAADISQAITGGPFAFEYGVFYKSTGGASTTDALIGYVDFGTQSITGATLNITLTNQLTVTAS